MEELRAKLAVHGQEHLLAFADELSASERDSLVSELEQLDVAALQALFRVATQQESLETHEVPVAPFPQSQVFDVDNPEYASWRQEGLRMAKQGECAVVLLAGGQGTRLGSKDPKGCYDIGLPSHASIFQLHAQRLLKVTQLAGAEALPFLVMTSAPTHAKTVAFFEQNDFFGLPREHVHFFQQAQLPSFRLDDTASLMLKDKCSLAQSPDGNGGVFAALRNSGLLERLSQRGVRYVQVFGVDNALAKVADPAFFGLCSLQNAQVGNKVVAKAHAHEKVGVMCMRHGDQPGVVEYSEISPAMAEQTDADGHFVYGDGNVVFHCFSLDFLRQQSGTLPYHVAKKKIPTVNERGETVTPSSNNGIKLETFLFDVFARASRFLCMRVHREEEFAPVKNKEGNDSPQSARELLSAAHKRRIEAAGGTVVGDALCEIASVLSYDGEGLSERCHGKSFETPCFIQ